MSQEKTENRKKYIANVGLIAGILIGITFLASGTGKVAGLEEVPAQVVDFITVIIPEAFLTPFTVSFLFNIFIPYIMPWTELILGLLIIIGFVPRLMAVLCLPLIFAFMGTNIWSIVQGEYATCASCFGIWEQIFGSLTPVQSLIYDVVLLALAIVVIVLSPPNFLSSRNWLTELYQKNAPVLKKITRCTLRYCSPLSSFFNSLPFYRGLKEKLGGGPRNAVATIAIGAIALILIIVGAVTLIGTGKSEEVTTPVISNVSISDITSTSARIAWEAEQAAGTMLVLYDEENDLVRTWMSRMPAESNIMRVDGLAPNTVYYFDIVPSDKAISLTPSGKYRFKTFAIDVGPPVISNVMVSEIDEAHGNITITWTTSRPCTSEVEYWISGSEEKKRITQEQFIENHSITLDNLDAEATYVFLVRSVDGEGKVVITESKNYFSLSTGTAIGKRAPDFEYVSMDGTTIRLSEYRGKAVMLDFWIWNCPGCREKLPVIQEAYKRLSPDQVAIVTIHYGSREVIIKSYTENEGISLPVIHDVDGALSRLYEINGFPTTFFIDPDGFIRMIDATFSTAEELETIFSEISRSST